MLEDVESLVLVSVWIVPLTSAVVVVVIDAGTDRAEVVSTTSPVRGAAAVLHSAAETLCFSVEDGVKCEKVGPSFGRMEPRLAYNRDSSSVQLNTGRTGESEAGRGESRRVHKSMAHF